MQASGPQVGHHHFLFIPATPEHTQDAAGKLLYHRPTEFVPKVPLAVVAYLGAAHVAAWWLGAFLMVEVNAGGYAVFWFGYFSHAGLPFCVNGGRILAAGLFKAIPNLQTKYPIDLRPMVQPHHLPFSYQYVNDS
jgi:hypothetical protein